MEKLKHRWMILNMVCVFVLVFALSGLHAAETIPEGAPALKKEEASPADAVQKGKVAKATYYADRYNGRKTSSGERYDSQKLTAAHATLPFGTRVEVVNVANGRSVIVKINDRFRRGKVEAIDLSRAAAQELGFVRQGKTTVRIIPVAE
ncbi:MAG: septal ring lytic transglycosylase RlpA family protein [Deltaproteobacteria bacterium]|nr:septal ring lytic transglycosylase RlpA family protein [Deltaproteobacteria bacterium]